MSCSPDKTGLWGCEIPGSMAIISSFYLSFKKQVREIEYKNNLNLLQFHHLQILVQLLVTIYLRDISEDCVLMLVKYKEHGE